MGEVLALKVKIYMQCGQVTDMSGFNATETMKLYRQLYAFPNLSLDLRMCRCNIRVPTSMRMPGGIGSTIVLETIMGHVACVIKQPVLDVRYSNFVRGWFEEGKDPAGFAGRVWQQCLEESNFPARMIALF